MEVDPWVQMGQRDTDGSGDQGGATATSVRSGARLPEVELV